MIELPIAWILGVIASLAGVITYLSRLLWSIVKSRISAQDKIIDGLRADIERMSKGCGMDGCHWRGR